MDNRAQKMGPPPMVLPLTIAAACGYVGYNIAVDLAVNIPPAAFAVASGLGILAAMCAADWVYDQYIAGRNSSKTEP